MTNLEDEALDYQDGTGNHTMHAKDDIIQLHWDHPSWVPQEVDSLLYQGKIFYPYIYTYRNVPHPP